jgi:hypothetical protein
MENKKANKRFLSPVVEPIRKLFDIPKRSISPAPSVGSQGRSSSSRMRELFGSTSTSSGQWALSLPLTSSKEIPGRETSLGKCRNFSMYILDCNPVAGSSTVITPDSMPPEHSSLITGYPDHQPPSELSGSNTLATQSEQPYDSAPPVRLIVIHRSGQSFSSTRSSCDSLCWSVSW